jgi:hypothetical protein
MKLQIDNLKIVVIIIYILFTAVFFFSCSESEFPEKEYEAYLNLRTPMLKDQEAIKKLKLDSTLAYNYKSFRYSSTNLPQYFKTSDELIDMIDILEFYNTIDSYHFKKMKIEDINDPFFKTTFLFTTKINDFDADVYSIKTKMDYISNVYINKHYGIVLIESENPLGRIKITKFKDEILNLDIPSPIELNSILYHD